MFSNEILLIQSLSSISFMDKFKFFIKLLFPSLFSPKRNSGISFQKGLFMTKLCWEVAKYLLNKLGEKKSVDMQRAM